MDPATLGKEGGEERILLALSIEPGQPTQKPFTGKKMARSPKKQITTAAGLTRGDRS